MLLESLRREVLGAALDMSAMALCRGTSGNLSARDTETNLVVITPTGIPYKSLEPADITVVDMHGRVVEGPREPSSEMPMHLAIYLGRPGVAGIVHTHSPYATAWSVDHNELPGITVPLACLGPVAVAAFELPGTGKLARVVAHNLGPTGSAVLLQNHGAVCVGASVGEALTNAVYVEEAAQVALLALLAGRLRPIPEWAAREMGFVCPAASASRRCDR